MDIQQKVKVIIVDDSNTFIEGLNLLFSKKQNFEIIGVFNNGSELLASEQLSKADIVLLDIEMPVLNGINTAKKVNDSYPNLPMVALTMYLDKVYLIDILRAGFKAFVHKPEVPQNLFNVIDLALNNQYAFPKNIQLSE